MLDIRDNLEKVQQAVERACLRSSRKADDVLVIAVSKTVEIERIKLATETGVQALGENRVQEAGRTRSRCSAGALAPDRFSRQQAKDAVQLFDWIHSVDREAGTRTRPRAHQAER
jgi:uncharacterized pyridoxal phosphate-containing UPF0001 family protein